MFNVIGTVCHKMKQALRHSKQLTLPEVKTKIEGIDSKQSKNLVTLMSNRI